MDEDASKTRCGHSYHANCIREWTTRGNVTCPMCRTLLFDRAVGDPAVVFLDVGDTAVPRAMLPDDPGEESAGVAWVISQVEALCTGLMDRRMLSETLELRCENFSMSIHFHPTTPI
jgi:hypothetical protein